MHGIKLRERGRYTYCWCCCLLRKAICLRWFSAVATQVMAWNEFHQLLLTLVGFLPTKGSVGEIATSSKSVNVPLQQEDIYNV